jgi:hypothetical protein
MANVLATLPAVAVRVADCVEVTAATVAVKLAEVAPRATVTDAGTTTDALLLPRVTTRPPVGAAAVSVTEQVSVPAAVYEFVVQLSVLRIALVGAVSRIANVLATLPAVAVSVADCVEVTAATVAVKVAEVAPEGTVTDAGTTTAASLLPRPTARPPVGAAAVNVTEQESVPAAVYELVVQLTELSVAVLEAAR